MTDTLFSPYTLGALNLPNRMVMAPMTRNRADENGVPTAHDRHPLCPAGHGRTADHRSHPGLGQGQRVCVYPRHLHRRPGPGMAGGHRCGSRKRRPHFQPALAHRPGIAHLASAGRRRSHRAIGRQGGHHGVHAQRVRTAHHAPGDWLPKKFRPSWTSLPMRQGWQKAPGSTAWKSTVPTATSSSSS
jgi:hypothetical protein